MKIVERSVVQGELQNQQIGERLIRCSVIDNRGGAHDDSDIIEMGILTDIPDDYPMTPAIHQFRPRELPVRPPGGWFTACLIIPTGIGCEIGGHAGDANPVAKLMAEVCDMVILHPNVVNASDLNEMPTNSMYVEGSTLDRFLNGMIGLAPVTANRILLVIDDHEDKELVAKTVNMAEAARAHWGMHGKAVVKSDPRLTMTTSYADSGRAVGEVNGLQGIVDLLERFRDDYDAVAIASVIQTPKGTTQEYYEAQGAMINPWGGVESMLTHMLSLQFNVPVAHAPMMEENEVLVTGLVDPRMAAEDVSITFLHSVLKGLHQSPRIVHPNLIEGEVYGAEDVDAIVIPDGVLGLSVYAAKDQGIPVIAVKENTNLMQNDLTLLDWKPGKFYQVETYLEATGLLAAMKAGIDPVSLKRPLLARNL